MKKTIVLGKIDYNNSGRKNCLATLDVELQEKKDGKLVFTASANVWNPRETDIYMGGQCVDEVAKYFRGHKTAQKVLRIWKRWHLNDMHAGCEHQRELGWEKEGYDKHPSEPCPVCGYKFGTSWNHEELPQEVIAEIKEVLS